MKDSDVGSFLCANNCSGRIFKKNDLSDLNDRVGGVVFKQ